MSKVIVTNTLLKQMFDYYNRMLFDNKLPHIPILCDRRLKRCAGLYRCYINIFGKKIPKVIKISTQYEYTKEGLRDTLIHEMIHYSDSLYNPEYGNPNYDGHGERFQSIANEINTLYGFNIVTRFKEGDDIIDGSMVYLLFFEINGIKGMFYVKHLNTVRRMVNDMFGLDGITQIWATHVKCSDVDNGFKYSKSIETKHCYTTCDSHNFNLWDFYNGNNDYSYVSYK